MKKNFLFGLLAIGLAGFGFGGISLADCMSGTETINLNPVASITANSETINYCSLANAIAAVSTNGEQTEIILLDNITSSDALAVNANKNVLLNLGGYTLTNNGSIYVLNGVLEIKNGTYGGSSINVYGYEDSTKSSYLKINDDVLVEGGYPIILREYNNGNKGYGATIDIYGNIEGTTAAVWVMGNIKEGDSIINVYGALTGGLVGLAENGYSIVNIYDGASIYAQRETALENRAGELNIYGGTLRSDGTPPDEEANNNGTTTIGAALGVSPYNNSNQVINVEGGRFEADNALIITNQTSLESALEDRVTINVTSGNFVGNVISENPKGENLIKDFIAGGIFSAEPDEDYIVAGKKALPYGENQYKVVTAWTVTFDPDNGSGTTDVDVEDNTAVAEPENPTNTGNVFFLGWFKDDNKYDFSTPVTASFTLTGKWKALSDSTGAVEDEDFTGVVLVPEEPEITGNAQTNIETAIASSNSTATMEGVVEVVVFTDNDENGKVEAGDVELTGKVNFTTARLVRIPVNTTGNVIVKVRHTGQSGFSYDGLSTSSGATCSGGNATPAYNGEGITPTSGYVEIYTCSASTFVAYTETANPAPRSSGGGGSSSYSCKSLPDNAVANNTSKPKKNTYYSYSTDTGAVCTFQCKSGYTWNEKDAKCEKTGETVADTETNKDETTATEDTENADTSDTAATEDLQKVLEDGYNVEFHNAYEFAFKNGITTMPTIEEADMNGNLNRIAMAKMLSQYAINVLGKTPDTTREVPNFPDVSAELDAQYDNGVTLAYQLGIMGIGIDKFRPDDLVTRAEFGTALSRMLFGLADGEELYYETHLQKLMDEKIITNNNPDLQELRGYVMIMLMRSAQ